MLLVADRPAAAVCVIVVVGLLRVASGFVVCASMITGARPAPAL